MCCDTTSPPSSSFSSPAPSPLMDLPLPLLELAFSSLPLRSVLAVSSSSKHLHSLISSLPFSRLHSLSPLNRSPWFFLFGFNHLLPHKNQAFAFDPLSRSWIPLPFSHPPPLHNTSSLSATNGILFALLGAKQAQLCIATSPLKQNWQVIEECMEVPRRNPIVGIFLGNSSIDNYIVLAGGVDGDSGESDELGVEVYDGEKQQWQRCESMPEVMRGKSMSSAVVGNKFYVVDCDGGTLCWMAKGEGLWREGKVERPKGVRRWQVVGSEREGLLAVALCSTGSAVKVYKLVKQAEGGRMEVGVREVGEMPAELFELFEEEEAEQVALRCCAGGGNLVYVYSDSRFKEYAACICELNGNSARWYRVPPLSPPVHRFDKVACLSATLHLSSCIPTFPAN